MNCLLKFLYKEHYKTKWYSSSGDLHIVYLRSFTGVLVGLIYRPVSIHNRCDDTRYCDSCIRYFLIITISKYDLKPWSAICLYNEALLEWFNLPVKFCRNLSFRSCLTLNRINFSSSTVWNNHHENPSVCNKCFVSEHPFCLVGFKST